MLDETIVSLPPLQGCLYCHSEGTTAITEARKFLGFGSDYPLLKCSHCGSVALFDVNTGEPGDWRIRYRRVSRASRYYYVAIHLGRGGWLSADKALAISTDGYVQRQRVQQAKSGNLSWLQPMPLRPPPPLMGTDENVYLTLRAVTYQQASPQGLFVRPNQGDVLDSGKLYVTDQKLHLLGQRRDWSHPLGDIHEIKYDTDSWTAILHTADNLQQYRGISVVEQLDAQLIATVLETLWRMVRIRGTKQPDWLE
jgi:hypothetical protein